MSTLGTNGRSGESSKRLLERLAAIKIHAGVIRRALRKPEPLDKASVVEQLDMIDLHVAQATQIANGSSTPSN